MAMFKHEMLANYIGKTWNQFYSLILPFSNFLFSFWYFLWTIVYYSAHMTSSIVSSLLPYCIVLIYIYVCTYFIIFFIFIFLLWSFAQLNKLCCRYWLCLRECWSETFYHQILQRQRNCWHLYSVRKFIEWVFYHQISFFLLNGRWVWRKLWL